MSRPEAGSHTTAFEFVEFSELESRRELWTELAARSGNIFATWEWADLWWQRFGAEAEPAFLECRSDGRPFAILPLCRERRGPLKLVRFVGHDTGDVLGPICAPEDAALAGRALRTAVAEVERGAVLLAEHLPGGPLLEAFGGRPLLQEANPRLPIDGASWEEYLKGRSKNVREKVRRSARKLERSHEVSYRLCEEADAVEDDMRLLLRLHRSRWEAPTNFGRERIAEFHLELAPLLLRRGWLRLWIMEVGGEPVAAWYGFRFQGTEFYFQSGRDPEFDQFSVGFLILTQTIRAAFDDGLDEYAFLRGDEPYKFRFATVDDGLETRALGSGALGRAAALGAAAAIRSQRIRRLSTKAIRGR